MKKSLLSLFVALVAAFTANAQENLLKNASFEEWADGKPTYWKTSTSAGNATLAQSEDAKTGSSSVAVSSDAKANKRLGYNEVTLKPGKYTFSAWVKSSFNGCQSVCGYAPIKDGKVDSQNYHYPKAGKNVAYTNVNSDWAQISYEFELTEQTELALVVMVKKNATAHTLLVDDASLTTTNGGLVEGTNPEPQPEPQPQPEAGVVFFDAMWENADQWTIENETLPEGLKFVWKHTIFKDKNQVEKDRFMKASAYYKKAYAATAYAISPVIQLTQQNALTFDHAAGYYTAENPIQNFCTLYIREEGGQWEALTIPTYPTAEEKFVFVSSGDIDLSKYNDKKVQFGFKYTSNETLAGTWEFKNFKVVGAPNSINAVEKVQSEDVIFDLSGRRVKKAENGIFIINGVKQLVK